MGDEQLGELIDYWLHSLNGSYDERRMRAVTATIRALTRLAALQRVAAEERAELEECRKALAFERQWNGH